MRDFKQHPIGVHPPASKHTAGDVCHPLNKIPLVRIPMNMQIGPGCKAIVQKGDKVEVGMVIGEPIAAMSVPIHASVSGEVLSVKKEIMADSRECEFVEIKNDGKFTPWEGITPPVVQSKDDFIAAVRASGLVGLGGAGFPTHFKLNPPPDKKIDYLLVNAMECEPYITTDDYLIRHHVDEIMEGIDLVMRYASIPHCVIGLERNTPEAFRVLSEELKRDNLGRDIKIERLKAMYPQGAEKVLIRSLTGRQVPSGGLPHDVGCLVMNVGSVRHIAHYLKTGMPLTRRFITLDGPALNRSGIYDVPIGARIRDLIEASGGLAKVPEKIIMGGPMMGVAISDPDSPILKMNNAILVFDAESADLPDEGPCIHCGRCSNVCPMMLLPTELDRFSRERKVEKLQAYAIMDCIECGSCTYICPAKRFLVQNIRIGKGYVKDAMAAAKAAAQAEAAKANK